MTMIKTDRAFALKNSKGGVVQIVREHYLRDDIPCRSQLCNTCPGELPKVLASDASAYLLPDYKTLRTFLEVFERPEIQNVVILQSIFTKLASQGPNRAAARVRDVTSDPRRRAAVFSNDNYTQTFVARKPQMTQQMLEAEQLARAALWYKRHLQGRMPVIVLAMDGEEVPPGLASAGHLGAALHGDDGVRVMTLGQYLAECHAGDEALLALHAAIVDAAEMDSEGAEDSRYPYPEHVAHEAMVAQVKSGVLLRGKLRVDRRRAAESAWIPLGDDVGIPELVGADRLLIAGMKDRNRALHGDVVCVELLPRSKWGPRNEDQALDDPAGSESTAYDKDDIDEDDAGEPVDGDGVSGLVPRGRVVGVFSRNWRTYVASLPAAGRAQGHATGGRVHVLAVPMDPRIPKIRVATRQAEALQGTRFLVRVDSWARDSRYPNGHFVQQLGAIGDIETETASLLVEHDIEAPPFSQAQCAELPVDTPEAPWVMPLDEIVRRRDLRQSHFIFSIDPLGAQDVDDTLSIRRLKKGVIEVGVHIADVSHFVRPGSLTDIEARKRGTTVYLPDRRYDMLPAVLSERLCSLRQEVDRFAFSVLWRLDSDLNIIDTWFGKTVIRSAHELHYEYAQAIFDATETDEALIAQNSMYVALPNSKNGALELESEEVRFKIEKKGTEADGNVEYDVQDVLPKKELEIHGTVAEFMIFANHHVAARLVRAHPDCSLLRHHPLPTESHFATLVECARAKGFTVDVSSNKALADSLNRCVDPGDPLVNKVLRALATQAMAEAQYFSTGDVPADQYFHYGLALPLYTHFTSPIRRYADLLVHRQLASCLDTQQDVPGADVIPTNQLAPIAAHLNEKHRNSKHCQSEAGKVYRCLYFKSRPGVEEMGIVVAIRTNGFVAFVPRYGFRGNVILKDRGGTVTLPPGVGDKAGEGPGFVADDYSLSATSADGFTIQLALFDHVRVAIGLHESAAHGDELKLTLVSISPRGTKAKPVRAASREATTLKSMANDIAAAEEKRRQAIDDERLAIQESDRPYTQTPETSSIYELLERLREMSLAEGDANGNGDE